MTRPIAFGVLLCGLAVWPVPHALSEELPKRYALVVGVNEYEHARLKDRPLKFAVADAAELAVVLKEAGFEVVLMTEPNAREAADEGLRPTAENVRARVRELAARPAEGEVALMFFAGHGARLITFEAGQRLVRNFLFPIDAEPFADRAATMIDVDADVFGPLERSFGSRIVLIDACRDDGIGSRDRGAHPAPPSSSMSVLFASAPGQQSFESAKIGHGLFTHFLLEGLRGRAESSGLRGFVTWGSLADYVKARVHRDGQELLGRADFSQRPESRGSDIGSTVLARAGRAGLADVRRSEVVLDLGDGTRMTFVSIPAGRARIGSPPDEPGRDDDETRRGIEIPRDFYLGKFEVTQEQYQRVVGGNPSHFSAGGAGSGKVAGLETTTFPVERVSWDEANSFCAKLTERFGRDGTTFRLPTEAEWEYACRAGSATAYHGGDALTSDRANFDDRVAGGDFLGRTTGVGQYPPNRFGLYDMHGNVWEWCSDADGPEAGRVIRGGSWLDGAGECRSATRGRLDPTEKGHCYGFRVVMVPGP